MTNHKKTPKKLLWLLFTLLRIIKVFYEDISKLIDNLS